MGVKRCKLLCMKQTMRIYWTGFPSGSAGKESACNAGNLGLIPELGRSPGGGRGNPLQYSCLENSMDTGAWWDTVDGITESNTVTKHSPTCLDSMGNIGNIL